jgi:hypothetical protein
MRGLAEVLESPSPLFFEPLPPCLNLWAIQNVLQSRLLPQAHRTIALPFCTFGKMETLLGESPSNQSRRSRRGAAHFGCIQASSSPAEKLYPISLPLKSTRRPGQTNARRK